MDATCSEVLELSDAEKETWGEVAVARFYEQKYNYDGMMMSYQEIAVYSTAKLSAILKTDITYTYTLK